MDVSNPDPEETRFFLVQGIFNSFSSREDFDGDSWDPAFLSAEPCHRIVQSWRDGVGQAIIDLLKEHDFHFDAVDCLRRPRAFSILSNMSFFRPDDHFVVITVRKKLTHDEPHLRSIMQHIYEMSGGLIVEVRSGAVGLFASYSPSVGSSLGLNGHPTSNGTLGGFVNLIDSEGHVVAECALTCDHVIRPYVAAADGKEMERPTEAFSDEYLCTIDVSEEQPPTSCVSPSLFWHLEEEIPRDKRLLVQLEAEIQAHKHSQDEETFPPKELRSLKLRRAHKRKDTAKKLTSDRTLGTLYASSGYGFSRHGHRLDWALVQVNNDRLPSDRPNKGQVGSRQILHSTKPQRNARVYKQGIKTGMTVGVVNPIQSYVATYDADGNRSVTAEWCIVSEDRDPFAREGDSGSLVLEKDTANVMGMIFGGHLNGGPVYFTSITAIANDIERVTWLKTQLPGGSIIES